MSATTFTFEKISDKYTEDMKRKCLTPRQSHCEVIINPSGCVMALPFTQALERIQNFKVLPDDVWVVTFPKCGTTWTQEMVWLLRNNLDFQKARTTDLSRRFPFFEFETIFSTSDPADPVPPTIDLAENLTPPRCIKSHLPMALLPKQLWTVKPKIIYVARDPKDVAISYYHHNRLWNGYQGTLEEFVEAFLNDRVVYGPYWNHVLGFLDLKDKRNILFNTYEEMKKDLPGVIRKTAEFLDVNINDEQVNELAEHLSFENMKSNKSVNCSEAANAAKKYSKNNEDDENLSFIRKGESGGWKNTYQNDILEKFKKWNEFHLQGRNFKDYPWSLTIKEST